METSLFLQRVANEIVKYEKILNSSKSKPELIHAEQRIETLCKDLSMDEMLQLDKIIQCNTSKDFV